jgi:hypothetical protein
VLTDPFKPTTKESPLGQPVPPPVTAKLGPGFPKIFLVTVILLISIVGLTEEPLLRAAMAKPSKDCVMLVVPEQTLVWLNTKVPLVPAPLYRLLVTVNVPTAVNAIE